MISAKKTDWLYPGYAPIKLLDGRRLRSAQVLITVEAFAFGRQLSDPSSFRHISSTRFIVEVQRGLTIAGGRIVSNPWVCPGTQPPSRSI
jgi:hypothetical protein